MRASVGAFCAGRQLCQERPASSPAVNSQWPKAMSFTLDECAAEIRVELRSILRLREDLRRPIETFVEVANRVEQPRYCVVFPDSKMIAPAKGLKKQSLALCLPDEAITDKAYEFAKAVWHLKDRLKAWARLSGLSVDVEGEAEKSHHLLICSDLANRKKHGQSKNRSKIAPKIGVVCFDTSKSGVFELYYGGATKKKGLLVSTRSPITFTVQLLEKGAQSTSGDAIDIISRAFDEWLPIVRRLGVLSDTNPESEYLREILFPASG